MRAHTHTHTHTHPLSIVSVYPCFPSLPTKILSPPPFLYHIPSFTCIYKPVLGLSPECRCLSCLLNTFHHPILSLLPPPAEPSACVLKWSTVRLRVGRRRKKGRRKKKKNSVEEENSSGSHCCLHGEQSTPPSLPTHPRSKPCFPPQLGFDMLKYGDGEKEGLSSDVASRHILVEWFALGVCSLVDISETIMNSRG